MHSLRARERGIERLIALAWIVEMNAKGIVTLQDIDSADLREAGSPFLPGPFGVIAQRAESKVIDAESERDESAWPRVKCLKSRQARQRAAEAR